MTEATLGAVIGVFADIHGEYRLLERALAACRTEGVETIALLGDVIDRTEQADACALVLAGWAVVGVYGNHDLEIAQAAARGEIALRSESVWLLSGLRERVEIGDILLTHEQEQWGVNPFERFHGTEETEEAQPPEPRVTFAGHTHFRAARDDRGPIDVGRGTLTLDARRRYLINPGALADGRFIIWDRTTDIIRFRQV